MKTTLHQLLLVCGLACAPSLASARTINWSSNISFEVPTMFNSQGVALDDTYRFEIGLFSNSFVANGSNLDQWAANWLVFDRAEAPADPGGWNSAFSYVTSGANHNSSGGSDSPDATPGAIFSPTSRAFLWVYNSKAINSTSEWALVTDINPIGNTAASWIFPGLSTSTTDLPIDWALSDADEAIYGKVNGAIGAGSATVTPGSYTLQTHAVPEPGGALMIGVAGFLFLLRKRRRS